MSFNKIFWVIKKRKVNRIKKLNSSSKKLMLKMSIDLILEFRISILHSLIIRKKIKSIIVLNLTITLNDNIIYNILINYKNIISN